MEGFRTLAGGIGEILSPNLLATLDGFAIRWGSIAQARAKREISVDRRQVRPPCLQRWPRRLERIMVRRDCDTCRWIEAF